MQMLFATIGLCALAFVKAPEPMHAKETRLMTGISSIAASPSGKRLWACWYAGPSAGENSDNYEVLATSADGGRNWKEVLVADPDGKGPLRCFDGELWVSPDGKLRWTFTARWCRTLASKNNLWDGGDPKTDRLMMVTLNPESEPVAPYPQACEIAPGVMMCKPTVLADGAWLFPVSRWFQEPSGCFYETTDNGKSFAFRSGITIPKELREFEEHQTVAMDDGLVLAMLRVQNGTMEAISADGGHSWSEPRHSKIGHPNSRLFITRLKNGHLLLVKHGKMGEQPSGRNWLPRKELRAFISKDCGRTWVGDLLLDDRKEVSYPDGCELADGSVIVTYDRERYKDRAIHFCRITEADVLAGKLVSPNSTLRATISQVKAK